MSDQILAILFADVSGSTTLYETLGDRRALQAVERVLDELRAATRAANGRVVKTIGDEILAVFPSTAHAAQAAIRMQERVAGMHSHGGLRLGVRIGFHAGPVLEEQGDVYGDAVNTASRMAGIAKSGQIVTTAAGVQSLPADVLGRTRDLDRLPVKGKQAELRVFELLWQDDDDLTVLGAQEERPGARAPVLHLRHGDCLLRMDAALSMVQVGRDAACDIVIAHREASRLHGRIERRKDKYVYTDLSTNGTFVTIGGDTEIRLRREEIMLRGEGRLAYGYPADDGRAELVTYSLV
jgi:class 3 adenylate cyclase